MLRNSLFGNQQLLRRKTLCMTTSSEIRFDHAVNGLNRRFTARSRLPVSAGTAFAWHERPGAFQRLTPPWEKIEMICPSGGIRNGDRTEFDVPIGPFRKRWIAVHQNYDPPRQFQDIQVAGPFAQFAQTHRIIPVDEHTCELEDAIDYRLPFGRLGDAVGQRLVRRKLERMFRYRHHITFHDLAVESSRRKKPAMKVLVTGATGLIGRELTTLLSTAGHEVFRLSRQPPKEANDITWNPAAGSIPKAPLEGLDAVVHLAGENIAKSRWTDAVKDAMRSSRVHGTKLLCETLSQLQSPPKTLLCASAIGYYGNRGDEILTEASSAGTGFLAELCRDWEAAAEPARQKGIRIINLRIGVVLSAKGGALEKMLTPFKLGVGGVVGNGRQYWSWVAIDDVIGAIEHCLTHPELSGPVNAVAPNPTTNYDFTKTLGGVLHRPTIFPMPAFAARLALGEMADELLLSSTRVVPEKLQQSGYRFRCPMLELALRHVLGL
jgi:uncharacterized protein (TIGR01777 family)